MKNLFKRTISILLAAMMLLGIGIVAGATEESVEIIDGGYTDNGIEWTIDSEGHLRLSGEGAMFYIYPQKPTDVPWFRAYREVIKTVTVGYGITDIGQKAFNGCLNLESISIPITVERINDQAFNNCPSLDDIILPSTIISIGDSAFQGCASLSSIIIPQNVSSIGENAFYRSGLVNLGICSDRTMLFDRAFAWCESLETITLSVSESSFETAFDQCFNIETVNFTGTQEEWEAIPFVGSKNSILSVYGVNYNSEGIRYIKKMYVSTPPEKMVYKVGEELDLTGMELTVEWSDGSSEKVTDLSEIKTWDFVSSYDHNATVTFEYLLNPVKFYFPVVDSSSTRIIGSCGPYSRWRFDATNRQLTITDGGELFEYDSAEKYPWNNWASRISYIQIDEKMDYISDNAFANCDALLEVSIYGTETAFGDNAFGNNKGFFNRVRFYGTLEEWKNLEIGENNEKLYSADEFYFNNELHPHSYTETVIGEATCTKSGSALYECECGRKYTDEIPMLEHQLETVTVSATCTEEGTEYDFCEMCESTVGEATVIPAVGHNAGDWEAAEDGKEVKKCTACSTVLEEREAETETEIGDGEEEKTFFEIVTDIFDQIAEAARKIFDFFTKLFK